MIQHRRVLLDQMPGSLETIDGSIVVVFDDSHGSRMDVALVDFEGWIYRTKAVGGGGEQKGCDEGSNHYDAIDKSLCLGDVVGERLIRCVGVVMGKIAKIG